MSCMYGRLRNSHSGYLISKATSKEVSHSPKRCSKLILGELWQWKERVIVIIVFKLFCNNWRFLHSNKRWCSLKGVSHVKQFEGVAKSYFDLCADNRLWLLFSLNIFLIIFELLCFSRNLHLSVNWSIFGTADWHLQETSLFQQVSQILRGSVLFLALAVAKLISCPLFIFRAACAPTFANQLLHFEWYHSVLESMLY